MVDHGKALTKHFSFFVISIATNPHRVCAHELFRLSRHIRHQTIIMYQQHGKYFRPMAFERRLGMAPINAFYFAPQLIILTVDETVF